MGGWGITPHPVPQPAACTLANSLHHYYFIFRRFNAVICGLSSAREQAAQALSTQWHRLGVAWPPQLFVSSWLEHLCVCLQWEAWTEQLLAVCLSVSLSFYHSSYLSDPLHCVKLEARVCVSCMPCMPEVLFSTVCTHSHVLACQVCHSHSSIRLGARLQSFQHQRLSQISP